MKRLIALSLAVVAIACALAASALAATRTVSVRDNFFAPKSLTVGKGTTVKWVWKGKAPHNVTVVSGPVKFRSTTQTKGTYSRKLTRAGTYKLLCTVHAGMDETIKVR